MQFNPKTGIECRITNSIANFKDECGDYKLDKIELDKIKKRLEDKIKKNYSNPTELNIKLGWKKDTYKPIISTENIYFKNKDATHGIIKGRNKTALYFLIGSIVFSLIINYDLLIENNFNIDAFLIILSTLQLILLFLAIFFLKDDKIYFRTTKYFLEINQKRIFFNDIVSVGIATGNERTPRTDVVFGTKSKGLIQLNLDIANISTEEISEIIKLNEA